MQHPRPAGEPPARDGYDERRGEGDVSACRRQSGNHAWAVARSTRFNVHPGSVLRRKRANTQSLSMGRGDAPDIVRITALVKDSDVSVDNLAEQVRKVVDVRQVTNLTAQQAVIRELVLVKVGTTADNVHEVIATADQSGGAVVAITPDTVTFEVSGGEEKISKCIDALQAYGIREIARSGPYPDIPSDWLQSECDQLSTKPHGKFAVQHGMLHKGWRCAASN